jgi:ABC-type branched-subunit amino acid transport system permease subunit
VGLPSWRLSGDYLAIVTLFVYQIFISLATNGQDLFGFDLTGGVNGIPNLDPFDLFGREIPVSTLGVFNSNYIYIALGLFLTVFVALYLVNNSRIGRAWRALREDELAAELMGMPTEWLKLLAFSFGAAVAALTGSLFASLKIGVFPQTFSLTLLITVYAMVILGGVGSQTGAVLGAVVVYVFLEALRDPDVSGWAFYIAILLALLLVVRPRWLVAAIVAGTVALGFVVQAAAGAIDDSWTTTAPPEADAVTRFLDAWVVLPAAPGGSRAIAYIGLVALILLATTVKGIWRWLVLVPTIYVAAFVWENVMSLQPDVTRFVLLGAMLVTVMVIRPSGILGERRVEIV